MPAFSANPTDLSEDIGYELDAIDYLRFTLCKQVDGPGNGMSMTIGDLTPEGKQRCQVFMSGRMNTSDEAVRAALNRFRPLAFSATFKLQDMIVEWILGANGVMVWAFKEKKKAYNRLRAGSKLAEPDLFSAYPNMAIAFWELYKFLIDYRGAVTHSGGVTLELDGTIVIVRDGQTLRFTAADQASYMRAVCIIAKIFTGQVFRNEFLDTQVQADLYVLQPYHQQTGCLVQSARLEALIVHVQPSHIESHTPLTVTLDFDHFRRTMESTFQISVGGRLFYSVEIIVHAGSGRDYTWRLPVESVPIGVVTMREGDPKYDQFLGISTTA